MPIALAIEDFLAEGKKAPIIDVRTPAEFEQGHIPGAYNIPLFTNEERIIVGTLYKKTGRQEAILKGLEIFGPRMVWFIEELKKITSEKTVCVHCWRGGMRSGSIAWLFELYGYKVFQLKKGYKSYRRLVLDEFEKERKIIIVGGKTGSGKTLVIQELKKLNEQVIDLEGLANHKGSSFGGIGEKKSPSQEQFENLLGQELMRTDRSKNLYLEDESRLIGQRIIPKKVYEQMRLAQVLYCDVDFEERAKYIAEHYGKYPKEDLLSATERIQKKLDTRYAKDALRFIEEGNYLESFKISLKYYDKTYEFGLSKREKSSIKKIDVKKIDPKKMAEEILALSSKFKVMEEIKLTQHSHGSGCGCKIAPKDLESILQSSFLMPDNDKLIVGNHTKDDAAVYNLGNDQYLISTTDFFTPITDDAFDFGRIAAANSISDVYAMGGTPIMAIAVLGWPVGKLPNELAQKVLDGGREICQQANIPLAGGHSIDSPEPFFGLAVSGITSSKRLKKNNSARKNDLLILTKPLGVGIISTAAKRGVVKKEDHEEAMKWMTTLNTLGEKLSFIEGVHAMTDVTGFGLLGHLIEMCEGSNLSAEIEYAKIPMIKNLTQYTSQFIYPDNTMRNWSSYSVKVEGISGESLLTLSDPQTNGGLLFSLDQSELSTVESLFRENQMDCFVIGKLSDLKQKTIVVI